MLCQSQRGNTVNKKLLSSVYLSSFHCAKCISRNWRWWNQVKCCVSLAHPLLAANVEGGDWHHQLCTKLWKDGTHKQSCSYGTLLHCCIEWTCNIIPQSQALAKDNKKFIDDHQPVFGPVKVVSYCQVNTKQTYNLPLQIISQNIQIIPWWQAARNIPDSWYMFHICLSISAAAAFHLSVQVVFSASPSTAPASSIMFTDGPLAFYSDD